MRDDYPNVSMAAYAIRTAGLRQRVRELWAYSLQMDYSDKDHRDTFHRLHCGLWDACIGPELPYVQQVLRTWPQRTQADLQRINERLYQLRETFIKPVLMEICGDMAEAHQLALFHQSKLDPKYDDEPREVNHWAAFISRYAG